MVRGNLVLIWTDRDESEDKLEYIQSGEYPVQSSLNPRYPPGSEGQSYTK